MSNLPIELVVKDYDHIYPLVTGDVVPEGIDLTIDRESKISRILVDESVHGGEMSLSKYLLRVADKDPEWVGVPVYPVRGFRHRCFFVPRGSDMSTLADLRGKRIGTIGWPETGNTWSRAAMRDAGVGIEDVDWLLAPMGNPGYDSPGPRPKYNAPPNVREAAEGRFLPELLQAGEVDALMIPIPPAGFYEPDSPIVRLLPDYRAAEQEYMAKVGFWPAHHIVALRRDLFEREPWVAKSLYDAFDRSKQLWEAKRLEYAETSPWLLADMEEAATLIGRDWQPYGVEPNRPMIEYFSGEQYEQGLMDERLDPDAAFADFERSLNG